MDFGSKFIYKYDHSESESVSDDDDDDNDASKYDTPTLFIPQNKSSGKKHNKSVVVATSSATATQRRRKRLRRPDTNVLSVKFNRLLQPGEMHAGDPVYCVECGAMPSHLSHIETEADESLSKWICEFCAHVNMVETDQNDLPKQEDATYLISPAPVVHGSDMTGVDDSLVLFLIDISGSMSSTTLVQGRFNLPNALKQQERAAEAFGGVHVVHQHNQTYVSRLQGVQMAVDANLDKLVKDSPTRRAALLTFNHEITYYGDGTRAEPLVIRGDKLNNENDLLKEAEKELNTELKPVSQTKTKLTQHVYDLEEGGQTALGPAAVFALSIASKRQGSKLVICTDGLANRGLGNLELAQDEKAAADAKQQALEQGNHFYAELTGRAREKGVSISVITIKGTSCLLPIIGQMADGTGGNVTIVDLLNMRDEFASILEQQIIATNAVATLIVHRGLYIRNPDNTEEKLDKIRRDIGNVTKHTEVTFEFGVRNKEEVKEKYNIDLNQLKKLPFQVQVTYTAADGSKALRALTQLKEATEDREIAEINAVRSVIAENHIRSTANDMMAAESDDEATDLPHIRSKWSSPVVQKQRVAYMNNLSSKVRSRGTFDVDHFNERRWNATSSDLQSHALQSKSRRIDASRSLTSSAPRPPPLSLPSPRKSGTSSSLFKTVRNKVLTIFSGSRRSEPLASKEIAITNAVPAISASSSSRRTYGFATSNLSHFSDQHSENLYRYKNISSDYMREESPTRDDIDDQHSNLNNTNRSLTRQNQNDDDPPAATAVTYRSSTRESDNYGRLSTLSGTRRPVFRRNQENDDRPAATMITSRPSTREPGDYDGPSTLPSTRQPTVRHEHTNDDRPAAITIANLPSTTESDVCDRPSTLSGTRRPVFRRNQESDDRPVTTSFTNRRSTRECDDDVYPTFRDNQANEDQSSRRTNASPGLYSEDDTESDSRL